MNIGATTAPSALGLLLTSCLALGLAPGTQRPAAAQGADDERLRQRVEQALESASDLPADSMTVRVRDGDVTLTGSIVCEPCGGSRTPGGVGTVQQSLGAVVRAIPGVERVRFNLQYQPN